jgi:S-adenosylmethionine-dependent methyltransferase
MSNLGKVRDAIRQELVHRQLILQFRGRTDQLRVLDAGCGQGTQALALARLGHDVVGLDLSEELLDTARQASAQEPEEVRDRLSFVRGDLLQLGDEHVGRYDLVCCHGVAMYLPSLAGTASALVSAGRPGALISLLTRNRAGIAMRAGLSGNWSRALDSFDARYYDNRLGIKDIRADEPAEVRAALAAAGAANVAWYGVRLFSDHWDAESLIDDFQGLLAVEEEAGRRDPYRLVAALTHTIAQVGATAG